MTLYLTTDNDDDVYFTLATVITVE